MRKIATRKYKEFALGIAGFVNSKILARAMTFTWSSMIYGADKWSKGDPTSMVLIEPRIDGMCLTTGWSGCSNIDQEFTSKITIESPSAEYPEGKYVYWSFHQLGSIVIYDENNIQIQEYSISGSNTTIIHLMYTKETDTKYYIVAAWLGYIRLIVYDKPTNSITYSNTSLLLKYMLEVSISDDSYLNNTILLNVSFRNYYTTYHTTIRHYYIDLDANISTMVSRTMDIANDGIVGQPNIYYGNTKCVTDWVPYFKEDEFVYKLQIIWTSTYHNNIKEFNVIKYDLINKTHIGIPCTVDYGVLSEDEFNIILNDFEFIYQDIHSFKTPSLKDNEYEDELLHIVGKAKDVVGGTNRTYLRFIQFRYKIDPNNTGDMSEVHFSLYGTQRVDNPGQDISASNWHLLFLNKEKTHIIRNPNWIGNDTELVEMRFDHWNGWYNVNAQTVCNQYILNYNLQQVWDHRMTGSIYSYNNLNNIQNFIHIKGINDIDYTGEDVVFDLEITAGYGTRLVETNVSLIIKNNNAIFENESEEGIGAVEVITSVDTNTPTIVQIRITDYGNIQIDGSALSYDEYLTLTNENIT